MRSASLELDVGLVRCACFNFSRPAEYLGVSEERIAGFWLETAMYQQRRTREGSAES